MPKRAPASPTATRKKQHIDLTLNADVRFRRKTTGLEELEFVHNALPELNLEDIDTSVRFLGKKLSLPLMISCMTGGTKEAQSINRSLAAVCEELGIAMGVGSQRQAIENRHYHTTFSVVRDVAKTVPVVGNLGAAEVAQMKTPDDARRLVELIGADAFTVHLNPLQEFLQPEGNTNFRGVLGGIAMLVKGLPVPVIVKEIGGGISAGVARRLLDVGVRYIDVAGSGGTSWAGIEALRSTDRSFAESFWDWGIPTANAVRDVARLRSVTHRFTLIASGGILSGFDVAKCIALGADLAAAARPMLSALHSGGRPGLQRVIGTWSRELRGVMFLTGSATVADLQHAHLVRYRTP
jgi:isopentenyl-diphosphate Delta-isomerase